MDQSGMPCFEGGVNYFILAVRHSPLTRELADLAHRLHILGGGFPADHLKRSHAVSLVQYRGTGSDGLQQ